jgi:hypothetical protein
MHQLATPTGLHDAQTHTNVLHCAGLSGMRCVAEPGHLLS